MNMVFLSIIQLYFSFFLVVPLLTFRVNAHEFDDEIKNTNTTTTLPTTSPGPLFVDADHFNVTNSSQVITTTTSTAASVDVNSTTSDPEVEDITRSSVITTIPTKTTPTTKPTTTTITTTTPKPKLVRRSNNRRVCGCDLHFNSCDMNCCCDMDCSEKERQVFSHCLHTDFYEPKIGSPNAHSCFRSQVFYKNNAPYHIQSTSGGMFCVVTENIHNSDQMEAEAKNVDLKFFTKEKPKFVWNFVKRLEPDLIREHYKYGSVLLKVTGIIDTGTDSADVVPVISTFSLPTSFYGQKCSATERIKFLVPSETRCKVRIQDLKSDCRGNPQLSVHNLIRNTAFISNPGAPNITIESLVPLVTASCSVLTNGTKVCEPLSPYNEPVYNEQSCKCFNVLKSLELTIFHAGIQGISKVIVKTEFTIVDTSVNEIVQEFSVNFRWRQDASVVAEEFDDKENDKGRPTESSFEETEKGNNKERETEIFTGGENYRGQHKQNMTSEIDDIPIKTTKYHEDADVEIVDWSRSGNPGYIIGKPIVMGTMVLTTMSTSPTAAGHVNETTEHRGYAGELGLNYDDERERDSLASEKVRDKEEVTVKHEEIGIALDNNPNNWMTIHNPGVCDPTGNVYRRRNVLFGIGHQSECLLNVSDSATCGELQNRLTQIMLGMPSTVFSDKFVSAFGNPDQDISNEWIPVLMSGSPADLGKEETGHGCDGVVSTLKIKIAFAYVGPVNFPQAKIIGVLYEFGESFNVPRKLRCGIDDRDCRNYLHQVTVATTVVFADSTTGPIPKIGQWPVVSIKLPQDFFYPFSATTSAAPTLTMENRQLKVIASFILLLFHYSY